MLALFLSPRAVPNVSVTGRTTTFRINVVQTTEAICVVLLTTESCPLLNTYTQTRKCRSSNKAGSSSDVMAVIGPVCVDGSFFWGRYTKCRDRFK